MSIVNTVITKFLTDKGYRIDTTYYGHIDEWTNYWTNKLEWHKYLDSSGTERKMYTLGMAKRIAEDWSSILFSERDEIKAKKPENQKYIDKKAAELKLYDDLPIAIEGSAYSGTCSAIFRVKNATLKNNVVVANERTKMDLIYLTADQIIPLKVEHNRIVDVAFVSEEKEGDKRTYYIEIHKLEYDEKQKKDIYWIYNHYIDEQGQEVEKENIAKKYTLNTDLPMFSILKTPIANPITTNNGLGLSMYANALDEIKACDITFNNFVMDFFLGGKKLFYNKKIVKYETRKITQSDGTVKTEEFPVYPEDVARQQWATYGDEMENIKDNPAVIEYNPDLRVEEDVKGIQSALDLASFKSSLGMRRYKFDAQKLVTATEYSGDRQDLIQNANKYRKQLDSFVINICKGMLLLGRILFNEEVTEEDEIHLEDVDGFLVDTETMKKELRNDMSMGLISKKKYLMKVYKMSEDEALKELQQIENENKVDEIPVE